MSLAANLPYDHPYAGGYPGIGSQPLPTDADALDYLSRVKAADGAGVEVGVATAVDAFVADSKALGVWNSIRASCILAGARTLAGALVPIKNEGPELWTAPTPTVIDGGGSCGEWDAETNTFSNDCVGTTASFPYLLFDLGLSTGKQYVVSGRLTGDLDKLYSGNPVRLGTGGLVTFNSQTGVLSGTVTPSGGNSASMWLLADATESPLSVTIESLSIREVIDDPVNSPVGNGFTSGDYSRTAGLTGDGTSYIDTSRADSDDSQNNNHIAVFVNATPTGTTQDFAGTHSATAERLLRRDATIPTPISQYLNNDQSTGGTAGVPAAGTLFASSRISVEGYTVRLNGANIPRISTSTGVNALNAFIFCRNYNGDPFTFSTDTLAFYSLGSGLGALGLPALDTSVSNLINRLKFALLVGENPSGLDPDTIDYIVRGYEAGGTLE